MLHLRAVGEQLNRPGLVASRAWREAQQARLRAQQHFPGFEPNEHMRVETVRQRERREVNFKEVGFRVKLDHELSEIGPLEEGWLKLRAALTNLLLRMLGAAGAEQRRGQLVIENPDLYKTFSLPWDHMGNLSIDKGLAKMSAAMQSDPNVRLGNTIFSLRFVDGRSIGGRGDPNCPLQRRRVAMEEWLVNSNYICDPMRRLDLGGKHKWAKNLCIPMALVVGAAWGKIKATGKPLGGDDFKKLWYSMGTRLEEAKRLVRATPGLAPDEENEWRGDDDEPRRKWGRPSLATPREQEEYWGPFGVEDLEEMVPHLEEADQYRVYIFSRTQPPDLILGPKTAPRRICLFMYEGHAYLITNLRGFLDHSLQWRTGRGRVCWDCFQLYPAEGVRGVAHRCSEADCKLCGQPGCPGPGVPMELGEPGLGGLEKHYCDKCLIWFKHLTCLEHHQQLGECSEVVSCQWCLAPLPKEPSKTQIKKHRRECGKLKCSSCGGHHPLDHQCFMKPPTTPARRGKNGEERVPVEKKTRWYGDIETIQDPYTKEQVPNLLILEQASCVEGQAEGAEPLRRLVYTGMSCVADFVKQLSQVETCPFVDSFIIFHNMGGFDGHFIMGELLEQQLEVEQLVRDQRFISITVPTVGMELRDSLLYIPCTPLEALPGMYGLEGVRKGFFPHLLNRERFMPKGAGARGAAFRSRTDGGRFPGKKYWEPDFMSPGKRKKFEEWYQGERERYEGDPGLRYRPWEELVAYCRDDVRILRQAFERFLATTQERHQEPHILSSLTMPSYANALFRKHYMPEDSIPLLPPGGFGETQSRVALAWMSRERGRLGLDELRHARNGAEIKIAGFKLDGVGWRHLPGGGKEMHVFEFHGCHFHCHPGTKCRRKRWGNKTRPGAKRRWGELGGEGGIEFKEDNPIYQRTLEKMAHLRMLSEAEDSPYGKFHLHEMWECELEEQMEKDPALGERINRFTAGMREQRVSPRAALSGGKTVAFMHDVECGPGEEIRYVDFKSLYPSVCACVNEEQAYPVGHPEIYLSTEIGERWPAGVERALRDDELFGLLGVQLHPPKRLHHPIIPQHGAGGKLLFPLCRTCGVKGEQGPCRHSQKERALEGVYTSLEVREAIQLGYRVGYTWEVWHFPQRSSTLLREFIYSLFLDKEYCSGWPGWVKTPEDQEAHIKQLEDWYGQEVDPTKFKKNSAGRQLAKLILNSCWGYFAKREDMSTTEFLVGGQCTRLLVLDKDPTTVLQSVEIVGPGLMVKWKPKEEGTGRKSAAILGAFTTAMARVRLNRALGVVGKRAIYCDTDSVMYLLRRGEQLTGLPTGDRMGELQDELETQWPGKQARGAVFSSLGPKTYALRVVDGNTGERLGDIVRYKGVIMTSAAAGRLTLDEMRVLALPGGSGERGAVQVEQLLFRKNIAKRRVETLTILKTCRFTSNKRRFLPDSPRLETLPFGHVD